jgi:hypothetical protein
MGNVNLLTIVLGALAFFVVGALWYGVLFGKAWRALVGITDEMVAAGPRPGQNPTWLIMGLAFLFELLISLTLAHQYAMTAPSDRAKMMIAIGYGAMLMTPALGINYLFQMRPGKLFLIDAAHLVAGMAAMGGVYCLMD